MNNLFVYGTLICDEIVTKITGLKLQSISVKLYNFSRYSIKNELFPAIIPNQNGSVSGVLYKNISDSTLAMFDKYEGEMYYRQNVIVKTQNSISYNAYAYIFKEKYFDCLDNSEWDFEYFIKNNKNKFIQNFKDRF